MLLFFGIAAPLTARASDGMDVAAAEDFQDFSLGHLTGH